MIEYELTKPMKGEEICDKILPAFQEIADNSAQTFTFKEHWKTRTVTQKIYLLSVSKGFKYQAGEAGPKQIIRELEMRFSQCRYTPRGEPLDEDCIYLKLKGDQPYNSITIQCGYDDHEDNSKIKHYSAPQEALIKKTVETINQALYGKKEDNATGLDKAETIL